MNTTRRNFLKQALVAGAGIAWSQGADRSQGWAATPASSFPILDTHTHFYDPTRPAGVPWPPKDDPVLYRRVLPGDFQALAQPLGITGTVVVEASSWVEDNQWILDLTADHPILVGLVGHLVPGTKAFQAHLQRFAKHPAFRGLRISGSALNTGLDQEVFMADLKRVADNNLELDVNGGTDTLPAIARLAERIPDLRVVINHVANLGINGQTPPAAWREGMRQAGRHPRVFCKVSGLVEGSGQRGGQAPKQVEFYQPVLEAVWEAFGEDRLVYGSNWPVCEHFATYATVLGIVSAYFQSKGRTAAEKFFHQNALKAYPAKTRGVGVAR